MNVRTGLLPRRNGLLLAALVIGPLAQADTLSASLPTLVPAAGNSLRFASTHPDVPFGALSRDPLPQPSDLSRQVVIDPNDSQGDFFGWAIGVDGDTAVVGAYGTAIDGHDQQGAAYVFVRLNGTWTETARLVADDGAYGDIFGSAVAISGSEIAVGAYQANRSKGAVYVFTGAASQWTQKAKLVADNGANGDCLGWSLAMSHGTVLAGAPFALIGRAQTGAAYAFSETDGVWTQTQEITADDAAIGDLFGDAVAIDGTTAVVGDDAATIAGNTSQGAAYVFDGAGGTWTQTAKLVADDGAAFDNFGRSVAVSGAMILVGAPYATVDSNAFEGAVYAYKSPPQWLQFQKLEASDGTANGFFGWSLGLSGPTAMVGATSYNDADQGEAYAFSSVGSSWTETAALTSGDDMVDFFGYSVAVSQTTSFVGEPFAHIGDNYDEGSAFVYEPATDLIFASDFDESP